MPRLRKAYSFDDVMLVPKFSTLNTRGEADLSTKVAGVHLGIPIIASNMSSVCEEAMAKALGAMGGMGIIHRMCSVQEQAAMVVAVRNVPSRDVGFPPAIGFSIGVGDDWRDRMDACRKSASIVCLDVAHGHHQRVVELLKKYYGIYKDYPIIIGQIASSGALEHLLKVIPKDYYETTAFKASIGGGSLCTTRIKTGFGVPTLQAIMDLNHWGSQTNIIADGGIKNSGDIVKALAAGAHSVMIGNLLAGTDEAPGNVIIGQGGKKFKVYRGSASYGDKSIRGEVTRNIEGEETLVPYKGSVYKVIESLLDGIRSGFSYGGAHNIQELQTFAEFVEITASGYAESLPHGK